MTATQEWSTAWTALSALLGPEGRGLYDRAPASMKTSRNANDLYQGLRRLRREGKGYAAGLQLAYHMFYGTPMANQTAARRWCRGKSETDARLLAQKIIKHYQTTPQVVGPGKVLLAPSYMYANSLQKNDSRVCLEKASELMSKAWAGLVNPRGETKERIELWFGSIDGPAGKARLETVKSNMQKIHRSLCKRPIKLYYRGEGTKGPDDSQDKEDRISSETYFGCAYPGDPPARFDQKFTHIWMGKAFFTKSSIYGFDSMAGVVIHELSHTICDTDDEVYPGTTTECYGEDLCQRLALNYPEKAVNNADNYEFFCESYQPSGWTPPDKSWHQSIRKVVIPARFRPVTT